MNKMIKVLQIMVGMLLFLFILSNSAIAVTNILFISPSSRTVVLGEEFTIEVHCIPGQPIKGYEFRLSFDATVIQANSVSEGDFFYGFESGFNGGKINNTVGTTVSVYGYIRQKVGNTSEPGTFATISFTALSNGTADIDFIDDGWTGVCNETAYLPINLLGGTIIVGESDPPGGGSGNENNPNYNPPIDYTNGNNNSSSGITVAVFCIAVAGLAFYFKKYKHKR